MTPRSLRPRETRKRDEDGGVLPLINVVFLLLIFFMVVGHLAAADPFHIEPPQSASERDPDAAVHVVLVGADGRVAFDGQAKDDTALQNALAAVVEQNADAIRLKADGGAPAVRLVQVMEIMRAAGVKKLHMLTVPKAQ